MHVHLNTAQGFQQPQATLSSAPITTSHVTQAPQTITPLSSQDYSQFTGSTIPPTQGSIQLLSEDGQGDPVLTEHPGTTSLSLLPSLYLLRCQVFYFTPFLLIGGKNQTDVATGQANPGIDTHLQGTMESLPGGAGTAYSEDSYQRQV